ncbi:protein-L-isoaspartate(D-aspartate) O-methyltransferase [Pleionea sp. CnH1-48]|uniref:protein-L-isoaspartate(D-aspartate) O-methyltransferase n=1 Tax=Pleionea sp. CnH1-48 TaxID=2954494 RepID=UPI0020977E93|nr:protein-L-isoaspartate(D-aspartate) O-methyltransferase [Pleionea sp. CnH1-48]MCO7226373.1 protein-L-isoaspartate(D-aspartate) O-methyltransferase [Pleionea sp. CnH1-48]
MNSIHLNGIGMTSQRTRERLAQRLRDEGITNETVLNIISSTPRHLFVDEAISHRAYEDTALPIGMGQTISQPFIVARMSELLLESGPVNRVLEIGTGSGYQTAVLSQFFNEVFTIERIGPLQRQAQKRLRQLKLFNIHYSHGDGFLGWPDKQPFDAIIVTAAPEQVPAALVEQLAEDGRMVIPVGPQGGAQTLRFIQKTEEQLVEQTLEAVKFVPLVNGIIQ